MISLSLEAMLVVVEDNTDDAKPFLKRCLKMLGVGLVFFGSASKPYFYTATRVKHYFLHPKAVYSHVGIGVGKSPKYGKTW